MIANLQPYPEYKESGLPWVEKVPAHWPVIPNRGMIRKRKALVGENHSKYQLLSLTKAGVIVRDVASGKGKFSSDMGTSQEVRPGDLVFCLFDVPETPRTVGLSPHYGMITGAYTVFECPNPKLAPYFELFYRAMDDRKLLSPLYSGLRHTIPPSRFIGTKTPQPPTEEQAAMVRFLDWANGRLERAIRAKRQVIALLAEQKQAIIHRAVTGKIPAVSGQKSAVKLKPSGIPWLGDIPQNWEVLRCGNLFYEVVDTGHPNALLLSIDRFKGVIPQSDTGRRTRASEDRSTYKHVKPGQLAYNLMNAFMGALGFSTHDGIVSPAYAVAQPRREIEPMYFHHLLRTTAYTGEFNRLSYGIMYERNRLYFERFKLVPALIPPLTEQKEIVQGIQKQTAKLDTTIKRLEREIELLREYRTRLVADVVTGKLDVRAAARQLPAEPAAPAAPVEPEELTDETEVESVINEE